MAVSKDKFGRKIDYLRISITDRCNLRCRYCMPEEGVEYKSHTEILSYEEIIEIVKAGIDFGITRIRITGGEPLVRIGVDELVGMLNQLPGIEEITMTTNGILLPRYAQKLKKADLDRVNISLDTLDRDKFNEITRRDEFNQVISGMKMALEMNLNPVKINTVLMKGINDDEIMDFVELTREFPFHVRFIEYMPLGDKKEAEERYISLTSVQEMIMDKGELIPVNIKGNGPAEYFRLPDGKGTIGFITPISHKFCSLCNRLRLTADGKLKPCLGSDLELDLYAENGELLDAGGLKSQFKEALALKPGRHGFFEEGQETFKREMFQIGG